MIRINLSITLLILIALLLKPLRRLRGESLVKYAGSEYVINFVHPILMLV